MCLSQTFYYAKDEVHVGWKVVAWNYWERRWESGGLFEPIEANKWLLATMHLCGKWHKDHPSNFGFHVFMHEEDAKRAAVQLRKNLACNDDVVAVARVHYQGIRALGAGSGFDREDCSPILVVEEIFYPELPAPPVLTSTS